MTDGASHEAIGRRTWALDNDSIGLTWVMACMAAENNDRAGAFNWLDLNRVSQQLNEAANWGIQVSGEHDT